MVETHTDSDDHLSVKSTLRNLSVNVCISPNQALVPQLTAALLHGLGQRRQGQLFLQADQRIQLKKMFGEQTA